MSENKENKENTESPYIEKVKVVETVERKYNPAYGDDRVCQCGHPYHRHFDSYEDMYAIGCKYCGCDDFKEEEKSEVDIRLVALEIATKAHEGKKREFGDDKGKPYIIHPTRVAESVWELFSHNHTYRDSLYCVGILHDVIEDTDVMEGDLRDAGIPDDVVDAVLLLTKGEGESYYNFIKRIYNNQWVSGYMARIVKAADIADNLKSLKKGSLRDKYLFALDILESSERVQFNQEG